MPRPNIFKRRYVVNRGLQLSIVSYSILLGLWVSLANFFFIYLVVATGFNVSAGLAIAAALLMVAVFTGTVLIGMVLTNRIAGPMFRLKRHMQDVVDGGQVEEIKLRRNDYFTDVVDVYNAVLIKLKAIPGKGRS
jgi:hypothetical protein